MARDGWRREIRAKDRVGPRVVDGPKLIARKTVFGLIVGGLTGGLLGTLDGYRSHPASSAGASIFDELRTPAGRKTVNQRIVSGMQSGSRTSLAMGGFYAMYMGVKALVEAYRGEVSYLNCAVAAPVALLPFFPMRTFRRQMVYGVGLVALDVAAESGVTE